MSGAQRTTTSARNRIRKRARARASSCWWVGGYFMQRYNTLDWCLGPTVTREVNQNNAASEVLCSSVSHNMQARVGDTELRYDDGDSCSTTQLLGTCRLSCLCLCL